MPLDHFVSQVHLKNWYDAKLGKRMHAIRKTDLKRYQCDSASQCRVEDGNTNKYLQDQRAVEEFLKTIEGQYNVSVDELRQGKPTGEAIYAISGFVSYVMSCSPAAMRINTPMFAGSVQMMAGMLDRRGDLAAVPAELGGGTIGEMIADGRVVVNVDPKYPQAVGIGTIMDRVSSFGNFAWDILVNTHEDTPFFTSDYPIANEDTDDPRILNRIVPLAPNLAIRIRPHLRTNRAKGFEFRDFRSSMMNLRRSEVVDINRRLIRSAETVVFYSKYLEWIPDFVKKNRNFRVEGWNENFDTGRGILQLSRQNTRPYNYGAGENT
ncbi:hypothetical protein SIAM614_02686 [Stappia aggregata IAM 12614]|uniref:DUF4238 domain-containing protein n=1 Tax=Roseibium aggregatum (strain ATCC 25650 / DSM 13394 / JCM 20685 / NBRC 16684 / NCIMB 2208 / IAM 12614 / B1) TaxID=384765 RepID=A0NUE6_ROSAI|nr:DUF4238 domain-containing protein [Roseibium aggregatum]EAV43548.1 hypothetical protein SIAM614_02686 [Stappia aggregata IAM 12614] [Roseibium aggregatum IAM 12614]